MRGLSQYLVLGLLVGIATIEAVVITYVVKIGQSICFSSHWKYTLEKLLQAYVHLVIESQFA